MKQPLLDFHRPPSPNRVWFNLLTFFLARFRDGTVQSIQGSAIWSLDGRERTNFLRPCLQTRALWVEVGGAIRRRLCSVYLPYLVHEHRWDGFEKAFMRGAGEKELKMVETN